MLQRSEPGDFVIATGKKYTLEDSVDVVFSYLDLDWRKYVVIDKSLFRPADIISVRANPTKADKLLGWKARYEMRDVAKMMVEAEMELLKSGSGTRDERA